MKNTYLNQKVVNRILKYLVSFEAFTIQIYDSVLFKFNDSNTIYKIGGHSFANNNTVILYTKTASNNACTDYKLVFNLRDETYTLLYGSEVLEKRLLSIENCSLLEDHLLLQDWLLGPIKWYDLKKRNFLKDL
jgi:hypothetical protein